MIKRLQGQRELALKKQYVHCNSCFEDCPLENKRGQKMKKEWIGSKHMITTFAAFISIHLYHEAHIGSELVRLSSSYVNKR